VTPRLPSTDLYFLNACGHRIARWWRRAPIRQVGVSCFVTGDTMVLVRRDSDEVLNRAMDWPGRLVYVIDDDVAGAAESPGLPDDYRRRLAAFHVAYHSLLLQRASTVLVPSDMLAERLRMDGAVTGQIRTIDPFWALPLSNQDHFTELSRGGVVRMAHLGSGSHKGALSSIKPALVATLNKYDNVSITYFAAEESDPVLASHPRVHRLSPIRWPRYRRWLARQRYHVALYPLDGQRFDSARSMNKLIEHGIVGAVGMYPRGWATARCLNGAAIEAPDDPGDWEPVLERTIREAHRLADISGRAATALTPYTDPAIQCRLWGELLGVNFV
jgi:hypothetical protein